MIYKKLCDYTNEELDYFVQNNSSSMDLFLTAGIVLEVLRRIDWRRFLKDGFKDEI